MKTILSEKNTSIEFSVSYYPKLTQVNIDLRQLYNESSLEKLITSKEIDSFNWSAVAHSLIMRNTVKLIADKYLRINEGYSVRTQNTKSYFATYDILLKDTSPLLKDENNLKYYKRNDGVYCVEGSDVSLKELELYAKSAGLTGERYSNIRIEGTKMLIYYNY